MPFPNLEGKHAGRPYVTARRLLDYRESLGSTRAAAPRAVVLTRQPCLFTVARITGAAAAAFVVSDVLHGEQWQPHFGSAGVPQGLWALFEAAEACLSP
jgi:hypothetical protein